MSGRGVQYLTEWSTADCSSANCYSSWGCFLDTNIFFQTIARLKPERLYQALTESIRFLVKVDTR